MHSVFEDTASGNGSSGGSTPPPATKQIKTSTMTKIEQQLRKQKAFAFTKQEKKAIKRFLTEEMNRCASEGHAFIYSMELALHELKHYAPTYKEVFNKQKAEQLEDQRLINGEY
jgi:hypothetical protein